LKINFTGCSYVEKKIELSFAVALYDRKSVLYSLYMASVPPIPLIHTLLPVKLIKHSQFGLMHRAAAVDVAEGIKL
jgi:hypothetical protein